MTNDRSMPPVDFPYRTARSTPMLDNAQRINHLRSLFEAKTDTALGTRVAAMLLLLYAQPVTRICELRLSDVAIEPTTVAITFDQGAVDVPAPFARSRPPIRPATPEHEHRIESVVPMAVSRL